MENKIDIVITMGGLGSRFRKMGYQVPKYMIEAKGKSLFEWSLFQFPKVGFKLSEVTRDLHANGICGVMTDYEAKFHALGTPINRCVGTMEPLPEPLEGPAKADKEG